MVVGVSGWKLTLRGRVVVIGTVVLVAVVLGMAGPYWLPWSGAHL